MAEEIYERIRTALAELQEAVTRLEAVGEGADDKSVVVHNIEHAVLRDTINSTARLARAIEIATPPEVVEGDIVIEASEMPSAEDDITGEAV